ncbi:hypothetical protein [Marinobacter salinus]|uniref:hypothetical protein n=1 Tax=Marinobacter salinus TaxID=1874317 RepID=UPI003001D877
MFFYGRSQRNVIHWKIPRFTTMFFDLRIKILWFDLGAGLSHGFNSLNKLVEIVNTKTDPTPLVRGLGSLQRIGTFSVSRRQREDFFEFERALTRAFRAEFGDVFDLEQRDFLDSQSELEADLNQRCVLFRVAPGGSVTA